MSEVELQDKIIAHALDLQRLSANDEAQAVAILQQLEAELKALLNSQTLSDLGKREVNALIAQADDAIAARYAGVAGVVDTHGVMLVVADNTVKAMQGIASGQVAGVTAETLASLSKEVLIEGAPSKAWWGKQSEDTAFKFAAAVRQGIVNGLSQESIVARVAGRNGFMEVARSNARALVHSSVMTAANSARMAVYAKNAEHADGVRWLSTLDSHTCLRCGVLDGAAWDFAGKPILGSKIAFMGLPPLHWNCRCVVTPIPKSLDSILGTTGIDALAESLSRRASKDGPVAGNTTFAAFLSRQSPQFIAETLGTKRAELFIAGKLTLQDLVNGSGRPLTLKELAARN